MDANACVYKTAKGAINRNYKVNVIQDGVVTINIEKINGIFEKYRKNGISVMLSSEFEKLK